MERSRSIINYLFITYLIGVLIVHIIKTNGVIDLENYFLGIRKDHWMHALLFFPLGFLSFSALRTNKWLVALLCYVTCCLFETIHYILPYRSFDPMDMVANASGATIGAIAYFTCSSQLHKLLTLIDERKL